MKRPVADGQKARAVKYNKHGNRITRLNVWVCAEMLETIDLLAELTSRSTAGVIEMAMNLLISENIRLSKRAEKMRKSKKNWIWHTIPTSAFGGKFYGTEIELKRHIASRCSPSVKTMYSEQSEGGER